MQEAAGVRGQAAGRERANLWCEVGSWAGGGRGLWGGGRGQVGKGKRTIEMRWGGI